MLKRAKATVRINSLYALPTGINAPPRGPRLQAGGSAVRDGEEGGGSRGKRPGEEAAAPERRLMKKVTLW